MPKTASVSRHAGPWEIARQKPFIHETYAEPFTQDAYAETLWRRRYEVTLMRETLRSKTYAGQGKENGAHRAPLPFPVRLLFACCSFPIRSCPFLPSFLPWPYYRSLTQATACHDWLTFIGLDRRAVLRGECWLHDCLGKSRRGL
jgi:hypothetical protein